MNTALILPSESEKPKTPEADTSAEGIDMDALEVFRLIPVCFN